MLTPRSNNHSSRKRLKCQLLDLMQIASTSRRTELIIYPRLHVPPLHLVWLLGGHLPRPQTQKKIPTLFMSQAERANKSIYIFRTTPHANQCNWHSEDGENPNNRWSRFPQFKFANPDANKRTTDLYPSQINLQGVPAWAGSYKMNFNKQNMFWNPLRVPSGHSIDGPFSWKPLKLQKLYKYRHRTLVEHLSRACRAHALDM